MIQAKLPIPWNKSKMIHDFNLQVRISPLYEERRAVKATALLFPNEHPADEAEFLGSGQGWCTITEEFGQELLAFPDPFLVAHFDLLEEGRKCQDPAFIRLVSRDAPSLLALASDLYLKMRRSFCLNFPGEQSDQVLEQIGKMSAYVREERSKPNFKPVSIGFLKEHLKVVKDVKKLTFSLPKYLIPAKRSEEEVLEFWKTDKFSLSELCELCKLTKGKLRGIIKRGTLPKQAEPAKQSVRLVKSKLLTEEINYLKELADDPEMSYSCRQMRSLFEEKFGFRISTSLVYYHLTKTLGYSYKKNKFKPPSFFSKGQLVVNYKVCEAMLDFFKEEMHFVFIYEVAFHLGVHRECSFSKV